MDDSTGNTESGIAGTGESPSRDTAINAPNEQLETGTGRSGIESDQGGIESDAPQSEGQSVDDAAPKKRRGRPPGKGNGKTGNTYTKTESPKAKLDLETSRKATPKQIEFVAGFYRQSNNLVALNYKAPDFVISEQEAQAIAEPLADILAEYGLLGEAFQSPWLKLTLVACQVYGQRVIMRVMMEKERLRQQSTQPATPQEAKVKEAFRTVDFGADIAA
jgi:hypothetical protein